ncbi:MAG TPA: toll/interleukin-1 receptor domain-containing protein [Saprospiraceae bacterium]|nr:toll/interleukin-1 receptor domain-containing protein [Saprospiraceae bacterium]HMQ82520.1 toll/interleukin-1 receptor domain-containing protein [Saprospiraceae bacterium]
MHPTEQYQKIIDYLENNKPAEGIEALQSFAAQYHSEVANALRMRKAEYKELEQESLLLGYTSSIRERKSALKLQLFKLADLILAQASEKKTTSSSAPEASTNPESQKPIYDTPKGEGPVKVFLAYAKGDENAAEALRKSFSLLQHTRKISLFDGHQHIIGDRWQAINRALAESEIVLLVLSNNFIADAECLNLQETAFQWHQQKRLVLIPVQYSPCEWKELDIGRLQALPRNDRFISTWPNRDEAHTLVSRELGQLIKTVRTQLEYTPFAQEPAMAMQPNVDIEALLSLFRQGKTPELVSGLVEQTGHNTELQDRALLLEQQWTAWNFDSKQNLDTPGNLYIRKNQLENGLLKLIRDLSA